MERFCENRFILDSGVDLGISYPMPEDSKNIIEYLNIVGGESDYLYYGEGEFRLSVEAEKKYIELQREKGVNLMLMGVIDNRVISILTLTRIGRKRVSHISSLGITVKKECWRKGVASKMMEVMFEWVKLYGEGIKKINLDVICENTSAIRLYERFGFFKEGVRTRGMLFKDKFYDKMMMGMDL